MFFLEMKTGLVLEGGGLRALFTAGVIDVMMENGITFDAMVGVSAGATFGCNFRQDVRFATTCVSATTLDTWESVRS